MGCTSSKSTNPYRALPSLRVAMGLISCGSLSITAMAAISASQIQNQEFLNLAQMVLHGLVLGLCLIGFLVWIVQGLFGNPMSTTSPSSDLSTTMGANDTPSKSTRARHWHILRLTFGLALAITDMVVGIWLLVKIGTLRSEGKPSCLALDERQYSQALCFLQTLTATFLVLNSLVITRESYLCWKLSNDTAFLAARKERREKKERLRLARLEMDRPGATPLGVHEYRPDLSLSAHEPHHVETSGYLLPMYTPKNVLGGTVVDVYGQHEVPGYTAATNP